VRHRVLQCRTFFHPPCRSMRAGSSVSAHRYHGGSEPLTPGEQGSRLEVPVKIIRWIAAAAAGAVLTACAPSTAPTTDTGDEKTGALKVWLYDEANRAPKEKVIGAAVKEFTAAHAGVTVEVSYIPTDAAPRAEKMKGAFNDPASAPDVVEFGNTDLAGYVANGGMADLTKDLDAWTEGKELPADLREAATVNGKVYGLPWWVGV